MIKYAGFVRQTGDSALYEAHRAAVRDYVGKGADLKWFVEREPQIKNWHDRKMLTSCLCYCRDTPATMVLATVKDFGKRKYESLGYLETELAGSDAKLRVADDPSISEKSVAVLAQASKIQRDKLAKKSAEALASIRQQLGEGETYTTTKGRTIDKLGPVGNVDAARARGREAQSNAAQQRAEQLRPILQELVEQGMKLNRIAQELNARNIDAPAKAQNPIKNPHALWDASNVWRYLKRIGVKR
jgi:hypothetical protein